MYDEVDKISHIKELPKIETQTTAIPASQITPGSNDRTTFAAGPLQELAESIREHGLAQPILLRPYNGGYQIVAGERRVRAITEVLGMDAIPREWVHIQEMTDEQADAIMLAENMQREDLNPIEEARAYQKRIDRYGWSAEECARRANVSGGRVRDRLKLLDLVPEVQRLVASGQLTPGYGEAMCELDANRQRIAMRYFQETRNPNLRTFRQLCGQLLAEQAQEALFDMDQFMREATRVEEETEAQRETRRFPVDERLPEMQGAMTVGAALERYLATLLATGHQEAAAVVGRVYEGLLQSNLAHRPTDSPLDGLQQKTPLSDGAVTPTESDANTSKQDFTMSTMSTPLLPAPKIAGLLPAPVERMAMTKSTIYTFGYERRQPEELVAESDRLDAVVVDVRIKPFSRRSDWAKSHLTALLGDRYRWVVGFGNVNYKGGPIELADPEAGLAQIADLIADGRNIILLCYEADPKDCHRSVVAELIAERAGCEIRHLAQGDIQLPLL